MNCKPVPGKRGPYCRACGRAMRVGERRECRRGVPAGKAAAVFNAVRLQPREKPELLGDRLAAFFESHGLTPETYQRWKADHGIDAILGEGCGCDKRKELLNRADAAVRGGAAKLRAFMGW